MLGGTDSIQNSKSRRCCWICGDKSLAIEMLEQRLLSKWAISRRGHKELSTESASLAVAIPYFRAGNGDYLPCSQP